MNKLLTGAMVEDEKPAILSEEAKKIKVPSWWKGGTTSAEAATIAAKMEKARNPA